MDYGSKQAADKYQADVNFCGGISNGAAVRRNCILRPRFAAG